MRTYKLYATSNVSQNNAASIVFARAGRIKGIRWALLCDSSSDNAACQYELSLQPVSQITVNDSVGSVDVVAHFQNQLTASGQDSAAYNIQRVVDVPIAAGERAYLNSSMVSMSAGTVTCFIDVDEGR